MPKRSSAFSNFGEDKTHEVYPRGLIGIQYAPETVLDTQNVVVDRVQVRRGVRAGDVGVVQTVDTVGKGRWHHDTEGVQAREVQGARGLELGGVQAVADDGHVGGAVIVHIPERRVVVLGNITEVDQSTGVSDIHTVHLRLELVVGGGQGSHAVGVDLGVVDTREGQELDGLSQSQLLHGVGAQDHALHLGDEQVVLGRLGKVVTLGLVQVHEVGPGLELQRAVGGGRCGRTLCEGDGEVRRNSGGSSCRWEGDGDVAVRNVRHTGHVHGTGHGQTRNVLAQLNTTLSQRARHLIDRERQGREAGGHND